MAIQISHRKSRLVSANFTTGGGDISGTTLTAKFGSQDVTGTVNNDNPADTGFTYPFLLTSGVLIWDNGSSLKTLNFLKESEYERLIGLPSNAWHMMIASSAIESNSLRDENGAIFFPHASLWGFNSPTGLYLESVDFNLAELFDVMAPANIIQCSLTVYIFSPGQERWSDGS